ncbi:SDR family oxidoreductase [Sneathiella marina]|uniref:SDR family oxidoreductase n=1 Tax=Sneathiella marina TaxID=2950108 RepID=A0ABY4W0F8_9PROT|nr:SDR family oxidoreductase [Sneathiella marina]USG60643.1 SDR family oxidoreductase [Sneathiella marina]
MFKEDLLKGKRILVTGGGTGLGKTMTRGFLEVGAEVIICGRRKSVLDETAAELNEETGGKISTFHVDIRSPDAIEEMVDEIWLSGPLDSLVNNAAGNFISRTEDLSSRAFDAIANIVFHGTFYMTNACGKRWIAEGRSGNVLSIVTTWIWNGSAYVVPSAMSKAGVKAMTQGLAVEWGPKGIRLNAIAPGPFPTEGAWARLRPKGSYGDTLPGKGTDKIPLRRTGEHSELANLATFMMADECTYINGEVIAIDGGQWLNSAGNYGELGQLTDEDWVGIRGQIETANEKDKKKRG